MSAVRLAVAFAILVALAVLAPIFGADTRPGIQEPPELFYGHRS
jgi:hypothetical protein